ncbi:hypothetical protein V6Z11_D13G047100 [Gossypium hirsutum]
MGASIAKIAKKLGFLPQCRIRIVMVGLDGSGKTTILYKLKLGDLLKTKPTIGFNVETIQYKSICFDVWDIGGESKYLSSHSGIEGNVGGRSHYQRNNSIENPKQAEEKKK